VAAQTYGQALAARAGAWYSALSQKRREIVQDTALALGLAVLNLLSILTYTSQMHPAWLAMLTVSAQCLPLAFRRVNPVLALICSGLIRNVYDAYNFGNAPLPIAPAIALATVADRSRPSLRWLSLAGTAGGVTWAETLPNHPLPYDAIVQGVIFGTAFVMGTLFRKRREFFTALMRRAERAEAELDAVAARAATAAVTERVRIARELHDVVAHHVSLMAVQAEATGALLPDRPEAAAKSADTIAATARQAMTELRRLLGVLRAPSQLAREDSPERTGLTPVGSLSRLHEVLDAVRGAGLPVTLSVEGDPAALGALPPGVDLTAYRIVQEALTNTLRHAPAAQASVRISYEDGAVTVQVADTGAGVQANGGKPADGHAEHGHAEHGHAEHGHAEHGRLSHGYGLAGIAERVASCGGSLTVGPVPAGGFAVTARLPVR
jgi:signal transduction histidine kinase